MITSGTTSLVVGLSQSFTMHLRFCLRGFFFFFFAVKISKILSCVLSKPGGAIRISAFVLETTWDVSVCRAELPYLISRNTSQSLSGLRTTVSGCFFFFDVFFFLPPRFYNTAVDISFPITKKVWKKNHFCPCMQNLSQYSFGQILLFFVKQALSSDLKTKNLSLLVERNSVLC